MTRQSVKIIHAALDEVEGGRIILRGVIDPKSFTNLQVAEYQREVQPTSKLEDIIEGYRTGSVPDIDLGMRGQRWLERDDAYFLQDAVYIIDGLQRVSAATLMMQKDGAVLPRLGAMIHFDTTEEWERARFKILNQDRLKLSQNVLMRNRRHDYVAVDELWKLSSDRGFVANHMVSWTQRMTRRELVTGLTLTKVAGRLHAHIGPGRSESGDEIAKALDTIMERAGKNIFRENVRHFFQVVDDAWGISRVVYKDSAVHLRVTFLLMLADIFSNHHNFWRGEEEQRLFVEADLVRKLKLFPLNDPQVMNVAGSSGKARDILYFLLKKHINSGKTSKRLRARTADDEGIDYTSSGGSDEEVSALAAAPGS